MSQAIEVVVGEKGGAMAGRGRPVVWPASRLDRLAHLLRSEGQRAVITSAAVVGFVAGMLDATSHNLPLWLYSLAWLLLAVAMLVLRSSRLRARLAARLLWGPWSRLWGHPTSPPTELALVDTVTRAPVAPPLALRTRFRCSPDPWYEHGLTGLAHDDVAPLIITPCNPRDVSRPGELSFPVIVESWTGTPLTVRLGAGVPPFRIIRDLPQANDTDHSFASRDVVYLPELGRELADLGSGGYGPLAMPEHCVDPELLAGRDLVVLSGPDTNFWHAALFEAVVRRFEAPDSAVPMAIGLRDVSSRGVPLYGSADLFLRLYRAAEATGRGSDDSGLVRLPEAQHPTYGLVLAVTNPLSPPTNLRWCVFVCGVRSLGTMAASLVLASLLRAQRRGQPPDVFSWVPVTDAADPTLARVSALLVRAATVEVAGTGGRPRTRRRVPDNGPDPEYSDSYVVTSAEVFDNVSDPPRWREVTIDRFPGAGWASSPGDVVAPAVQPAG